MGSQKAEDSRTTPSVGAAAPVVPPPTSLPGDDERSQLLPSDGGAMIAEECPVLTVESLIRDHHAALYRYAFRLTGAHCDAEDLVQQAFMITCRKLDQVREPQHITAWLYAVLRSCYLKSRRKIQPQAAGPLEINLDQMPDLATAPEAVDRDELQAALDELPDEYKLVVVMFYFEHSSYKQIADRLDLPIGTVMSRLARAKQRLRARLAPERPPSSTSATSAPVRLAERTTPPANNENVAKLISTSQRQSAEPGQ